MKFFRHGEVGQRGVVVCAVFAAGPGLGCLYQIAPVIRPSAGPIEELIDALLCGFGVTRHGSLPILTRVASHAIVSLALLPLH